jgi:hypothetical protein
MSDGLATTLKAPLRSVIVPVEVPLTNTVAPVRGSPSADDVTTPLIVICAEIPIVMIVPANNKSNFLILIHK